MKAKKEETRRIGVNVKEDERNKKKRRIGTENGKKEKGKKARGNKKYERAF